MTAQPMRVSFNPKRDLPYVAAAAEAILMAFSCSILFGPFGWVIGGVLGVEVSLSLAYATSQYNDIAKGRKPFAALMMVALISGIGCVFGTASYLGLPEVIVPVWRGVVGGFLGTMPAMALSLVGFTAGKGLVKADENTTPPMSKSTPEPRKAETDLRKPVTNAALIAQLRKTPGATDEQLAQVFNVSRQAIQQRRKKLTPVDMGLAK